MMMKCYFPKVNKYAYKSDQILTKVAVRAVWAFPSGLAAGQGLTSEPGPGVHETGLSDGCYQVLVLCVPPAPPADLWLAAASDHRPVPLVPGRTVRRGD